MRFDPRRLMAWLVMLAATGTQIAHADEPRLGRIVVPTAQAVQLKVDAKQEHYSGSVQIAIRITEPTESFKLSSREIEIESVSMTGAGGVIPVTYETAPLERIRINAETTIEPGEYTLGLSFTNEFNTRAVSLYRLETGGEAYTFTQFQAVDARGAFPCWDEPEFKIPWRMTLIVPEGDLAVSNTPVESESTTEGWTTVRFKETKPLSSYLLAIATGPLETVELPGMKVPGRVVTVKGASHMTTEAIKVTPPIMAALEEFFGRKYPYEKLDLIGVPEFWPGAMENAGAITFADNVLLLDPERVTPSQTRRVAEYVAHEVAHMWFGDLVTMEWWDDLWLNESFASWLGDKVTDQVYPEFKMQVRELGGAGGWGRARAYDTDARLSTRAMRKPVGAEVNLEQLADELAYNKGQAVLGMVENWLGEKDFRNGVRKYINAHAWGNATGADLWESLGRSAGEDVAKVMTSFLNQPGVPLVSVEPVGDGQVRIRQQRFLNYGLESERQIWQIPVKLKFSNGQRVYSQTVLLDQSDLTVTLKPKIDPAWIHPNDNAMGYYRWTLPSQQLLSLANNTGSLTAREKIGYLGNLEALLLNGAVRGDDYLRALEPFAQDTDADVVGAVITALDRVQAAFVAIELEPAFASFVRRTLGPAWERIGIDVDPQETPSVTAVRPPLIRMLGDAGQDGEVRALAKELARTYLDTPAGVDPSIASAVMQLAALDANETMYEECQQRFETTTVPIERRMFLTTLSHFRHPRVVERHLDYILNGPLRPQELRSALAGFGATPRGRDRMYRFVTENYDRITTMIPPMMAAYLPIVAAGCSAKRLEAAERFFSVPEHQAVGTDVTLAKVGDAVKDCVSLRDREGAAVASYLTGKPVGTNGNGLAEE